MNEVKRGVFNRYMLLSVTMVVLVMCQSYIDNQVGWKKVDVLALITYPLALSGFVPFAGVFPMLPYGLSFSEEYNAGFLRYALLRQRKRDYILKKITAVAWSGGVMMWTAFMIVFLVGWIIGVPSVQDTTGAYSRSVLWNPLISLWGGWAVMLLKAMLAFLFGCSWSMMCLLISVIFTNKYISFMGTFLVFQLWWSLGGNWNPVGLLRGDDMFFSWTSWNPFLMQLMVLAVVSLMTGIFMERKVRHV